MKVLRCAAVLGLVFACGAPCAAGNAAGGPPPRPPVRVAQISTLEDQKQDFILQTNREVSVLSEHVGRLSTITPTDGGANPAFSDARRNFNDKLSVLQGKLATLRSTPGEYAQGTMLEAGSALDDLRNAYSAVVDAAR